MTSLPYTAQDTPRPQIILTPKATPIFNLLQTAARYARLLLVFGLICGLTLPGIAQVIKDWLPVLVALLLCVSAMRIGPKATLGSLADLGKTSRAIVILQLALPVAALGTLLILGATTHPLAIAVILMLAAPSISGAPNFTAIMGHDPAPPMRLLTLGTAVFPITAMATLWIAPGLGGVSNVFGTAIRLIAVIALSVGAGFALRHVLTPRPNAPQIQALDGASALLLSVMVVGLMAALGPALRTEPATVVLWLLAAITINLGLQIAAFKLGAGPGTSIIAGNRNIALYLVALPAATTDPLLIFIGCYQIPMYLTPILMHRLYKSAP